MMILQQQQKYTEWMRKTDSNEADLGRFSQAIYRKVTSDAKMQQFQGFRPGTIPPHIEPTYRAFAMDECARETVLEAMEQNDIRPFADARNELFISNLSIPPPAAKKGKKKKGGRKKKKKDGDETAIVAEVPQVEEEPAWLTFETMKEAIDAGWKVREKIFAKQNTPCKNIWIRKLENRKRLTKPFP